MMTEIAPKKLGLLDRIVRTIQDRQLFAPKQHLLLAVSGGPDSVALLSLLATLAPAWQLTLTVVHFNYGLRGSESDGDESFVASMCQARNIPLVVRRPFLAKRRRASSIQLLARWARYEAMKSLAHEIGADRIVTGHTANDQAETMLMWMLRGAGLTGLAGMPFIREQIIVRPLLRTTRKEILNYLKQEGLSYRQDSTNLMRRYRRNRVRHDLLPVMEDITPEIVRLLERQADVLRADEDYLEQVVADVYLSQVTVDANGNQRFDRQAMAALPGALKRRLVRYILKALDPERRAPSLRVVDSVLRLVSDTSRGRRVQLREAEVIREHERVLFVRRGNKEMRLGRPARSTFTGTISLSVPSTVYWPGTSQEIQVQEMTIQEAQPLLKQRARDCAVFDMARLSTPLVLRSWQAGDRIHPVGMGGKSKKLQDFFTDLKLSREERSRIPLLAAPEGILWVVGRRKDERFVARKTTSRCLVVTVHSNVGSEGAE
jgi:tRNA(Ile)-lysidine synthase